MCRRFTASRTGTSGRETGICIGRVLPARSLGACKIGDGLSVRSSNVLHRLLARLYGDVEYMGIDFSRAIHLFIPSAVSGNTICQTNC
jgi:hypothetical protein